MSKLILGDKVFERDVSHIRVYLANLLDGVAGVGDSLNKIIRYPSGTGDAVIYAKTEAGFAAALAAASSGDTITIPGGTITFSSEHTVPQNVAIRGRGKDVTILDFDTDDDAALILGGQCEISGLTIDYNCTAGAGSKSCYVINGADGTNSYLGVYLENIRVVGVLANAQTRIRGIYAYLPYNATETKNPVENVDVYVSGSGYNDGFYGLISSTGKVVLENVNAVATSSRSDGYARGIVADYSTIGSPTPEYIMIGCTGYATASGATAVSTYGIYINSPRSQLYSCYGYAEMTSNGSTDAVGILNGSGKAILVSCYGYGSSNNTGVAGAPTCGINWQGDGADGSFMIGCHGYGNNAGDGYGYGIFNDSYGSAPMIGCSAIGSDYDLGADTDDVVLIYGSQFDSSNNVDTGSFEYMFGDRDANHVQTITADKTLDLNDFTVIVDASGDNVTVTLPAAASSEHKRYTIVRVDSSENTVTIDGNASETINDQETQTLTQFDAVRIECDGTEWWITSLGGSGGGGDMDNPMTTEGDMIYASDGSGTPARLAIGSADYYLKSDGTVPVWAAVSGGSGDVATDTIWNAEGDILYATGDDAGTVLAIGANNTYLKSNGTVPVWDTVIASGSVAADTLWNATGDILYATGDNAGTILAIGTAGQYLTTDGTVPSWGDVVGGSGDVATDTIWNAEGDILYATGDDAGTVLPIGAVGYVLTVSAGTIPSWMAASGGAGSSSGTVVLASTDTGASPHSISTTGVAEGDLAIWAMTTRNSIPNVDGPEGGGWTKLWSLDTGSDEYGSVWYKICGDSEDASWEWTHSAGSTVFSGVVVFRNLDGTLIHYGVNNTQTCPVVLGAANGIQVVVYHACYQATSVSVSDPTSLLTEDINADNNDQGLIISHRDALYPAAQPNWVFNGGNTDYVASGAIVFE